jgi:prepilin-type N-terminal cleavage/methylation domain-containing protein
MKGFTLIEIIIVIAISAVLTTIAIAYNVGVRNEVALSVETAKISQTILTAKGLAFATYRVAPGICGYGVYFNIPSSTYSIFAYEPSAATYGPVPPCPSIASTTANGIAQDEIAQYSQGTWNIATQNGVRLNVGTTGNAVTAVLFFPPQPFTLISTSNANPHPFGNANGTVHLLTVDGKSSSTISVTLGGQVNY